MARSEVRGFVYYFCRTYKDQSKTACTKHSIKHDRLEAAVLYAVQRQVYNAFHYSNAIASINKAPLVKSQSDKIQAAISLKEKELAKVTRYKQAVWQDWKDGELSHMDYRHLREDYEAQAQELMQVIETLKAEQAGLEKGIDVENPVLVTFRQFQNIDKLTREVLVELVEQIKIYDNGNISVKFKFSDEIRRICEYIDMNTQLVAV